MHRTVYEIIGPQVADSYLGHGGPLMLTQVDEAELDEAEQLAANGK